MEKMRFEVLKKEWKYALDKFSRLQKLKIKILLCFCFETTQTFSFYKSKKMYSDRFFLQKAWISELLFLFIKTMKAMYF